jgi:FemAB-related protein (PEP-CTERM system-associated)
MSATGAGELHLRATQLSIRTLERGEEGRWDDFVLSHPHGSPFHMIAWKRTIEETFRYRPVYLMATEGERIRGVLPLFFINNLLAGKVLLSVPFAVYGGALADSAEAQDALRAHVQQLAEAMKVSHVELRNGYEEQRLGFTALSRYVTFTTPIGPDEQALLEAIPRKTRAAVRKSFKQNFQTVQRRQRSEAFEDLYLRSLRRLGTPAFPRDYFTRLAEHFGPMADFREIHLDGKAVAAVMTFYFRDQVMPYYGASDPAYNAAQPNNFMYFDLMRWGGANGFTTFDFGRSKKAGSGSYDFKCHWGMEERELPYEMLLVRRKELPNLTPNNPIFRLPGKIWQRLPLPVTRALGPWLIRLVP